MLSDVGIGAEDCVKGEGEKIDSDWDEQTAFEDDYAFDDDYNECNWGLPVDMWRDLNSVDDRGGELKEKSPLLMNHLSIRCDTFFQ